MEQRKGVIFKPKAAIDLEEVFQYILDAGLPERAQNYLQRIRLFGEQLATFPESHVLCRQPKFNRFGFRCAVFEGTYIFVYKVEIGRIVIFRVIHGKLLK